MTSQLISVFATQSPDINGDGFITPMDAIYVINRIGSVDPGDLNADIDGSGTIDANDVDEVIALLGSTYP